MTFFRIDIFALDGFLEYTLTDAFIDREAAARHVLNFLRIVFGSGWSGEGYTFEITEKARI